MKKLMLAVAIVVALTVPASARIITYTWHQTSTTWPGLVFTAYYKVDDSVPVLPANSNDPSPNFGGLVDLYIQGGSYPVLTLANLIQNCGDPGGCTSPGMNHNFGYPFWQLNLPYLLFVNAEDFEDEPFHFEWEYWATATTILIGDDNANTRCWDTSLCTATGYWQADFNPVPEPGTILVMIGGLALSGLGLRRRLRLSP